MSLTIALANAHTGLSAAGRHAEVTAHNIANSTTPGFARRNLLMSAQAVDGVGYGVVVNGTTLAAAESLTAERREADAEYGYQNVVADGAEQLAALIGDSDDPGALFARYQDFEQSVETLSETPDAEHLQRDMLYRAQDLAQSFNTMNDRLLDIRADADREIARQVEALNTALVEFDKINRDIETSGYRGEDVTEIHAQRNAIIDTIAQYIPIQVQEREGERVALVTSTGYTLVDAGPATISFTRANVVGSAMDFAGVMGAAAPGALSGLQINGVDVTPPNAAGNPLGGGSIAGLFQVRDIETVEFQQSIDALADNLIDRMANLSADPWVAGGGTHTIFTDAQGAPSAAAGIAGRIEVNNALDPDNGGSLLELRDGVGNPAGDAGDNSVLRATLHWFRLDEAAPAGSGVSGTMSASELAAEISSLYSTKSVEADRTLALRSSRQDTLYGAEMAQIGVDLDYELANLDMIQTAYTANARVMQVIDEMMRRLMEI